MKSKPIVVMGGGVVAAVVLAGTCTLGSAAGAAQRIGSTRSPVGVTLTGSAGCRGAGRSLGSDGSVVDAATAPGGGGASSAHPLVVDQNGTVHWHGSTRAVITDHTWWVHVDGLPVKSGGSTNAAHLKTTAGVEYVSHYLPSWLGLTGVFYVNGQISGTGGTCTGAVYVQFNGDPATGALFWIAVVLLLGAGFLLFFALPTWLAPRGAHAMAAGPGAGSGASRARSAAPAAPPAGPAGEPPGPAPPPEPDAATGSETSEAPE